MTMMTTTTMTVCILLTFVFQPLHSFQVVIRPHHFRTQLLPTKSCSKRQLKQNPNRLYGWLDAFLPAPQNDNSELQRQQQYPEQYPATYEMSDVLVETDIENPEIQYLVRPLLKSTQLESRPLQLAYNANVNGWSAQSFHECVDGKGAAVVVASTNDEQAVVGGYNPKGWAGYGGARPSVAAFLFYPTEAFTSLEKVRFQKLQKVGGGGLACCKDEANYGIALGADGLIIPLSTELGNEKVAISKLGPYYERGPENRSTLFSNGASMVELSNVKVYVGVYDDGEEIPYSGAVLDMTSG